MWHDVGTSGRGKNQKDTVPTDIDPWPKVGAILKKSVDWSDTDVILSEESIDKAIVSLQIPEVLNDEAIQVLLWKKILNRQSDCIVSNPRIFKGEAIQILLRQKIWIVKAIVSLQTAESFSDEAMQVLLILLPGGMRRFTDLIVR